MNGERRHECVVHSFAVLALERNLGQMGREQVLVVDLVTVIDGRRTRSASAPRWMKTSPGNVFLLMCRSAIAAVSSNGRHHGPRQ